MRRPAGCLLLIVALSVAACGGLAPSVEPAPPASEGPVEPAPAGTPQASGGSDPGPLAPSGPSSGQLINAAREAGTIDAQTALLYRLQAVAGDDRLPEAYAGPAAEDDGASAEAAVAWATSSDAQRSALLPYLVRPTDVRSVFAPATTTAQGTVVLAAAKLSRTAAACENGFMRLPSTARPFVVWGQCGADDAAMAAHMDDALAILETAWAPMTAIMGQPIGDKVVPDTSWPDSPEAGDGLLDVYLIATGVSVHARRVANRAGALAVASTAPPFDGPLDALKSSGYIVANGTVPAGVGFKSTIVHEFFHLLEYAHNNLGTSTDTSATDTTAARWWFVEASAVWAEHQFVPEGRPTEVYPRFTRFQVSGESLASGAGANEYDSWVWPYFLAQEDGPEAIGAAWTAVEGKDGFDDLQAALDDQTGLRGRFDDFAVRGYNEDLQPGDVISPLFSAADASFPGDQPSGARWEGESRIALDEKVTLVASLPPLWARYYALYPEPDVTAVDLDLSGLVPSEDLVTEVLFKTEDGWERRSGDVTRICKATEIIVILGSKNLGRSSDVEGSWTARGSSGCGGNWSVTLTGAKLGAGTYEGTAESIGCSTDGAGNWRAGFYTADDPDIIAIDVATRGGDSPLPAMLVTTRQGWTDPLGPWEANEGEHAAITITANDADSPWTIHAQASWVEIEGTAYNDPGTPLSIIVDLTCTEMDHNF